MKSRLQNKKECYACRVFYGKEVTENLEEHHFISGNSNRALSEHYGLKAYLCYEHHRGTRGVHGRDGAELNKMLHQIAQATFERDHTREETIEIFGKSWL